ncbi:MAG: uroporphyrinogen decarboxylase family protein [Bacillota bacterium]
MNLRKKYIKAVKKEINDYIPYYFHLTPPQVDNYKAKYGSIPYSEKFKFPFRDVRAKYIGENPEEKFSEYLISWKNKQNLSVGIFGDVQIKASDSHFTHKEAIMKDFSSIEEFDNYPYPDPINEFDWDQLNREVGEIHHRGLAVMGQLAITIFEIGWYLRGMEQMLMDFIKNQELLNFHLDKITEIRCLQAQKMAEAGVDVLHLGDDIATQRGMMIQPQSWRKFLKNRLAKVINSAKRVNSDLLIKYHTDGNPEEVIPDLIEIGVDILNPIQPECIDPVFVKEEYGESLALDGTLGTQSVFPFGSPQDVKKQCLKRIKTCGYNGGLILAPSHTIEPEVPWENIEAFINTVRNYNNKN